MKLLLVIFGAVIRLGNEGQMERRLGENDIRKERGRFDEW